MIVGGQSCCLPGTRLATRVSAHEDCIRSRPAEPGASCRHRSHAGMAPSAIADKVRTKTGGISADRTGTHLGLVRCGRKWGRRVGARRPWRPDARV